MTVWAAAADDRASEELVTRADPERAAAMVSYMRDRFAFHGVTAPERREVWRLVRDTATERAGAPTHDDVVAFARAGWARPEREHQYLAATALVAYRRLLGPGDLPLLAELITTRSWWDTVDVLAPNVVGPLALVHAEVADETDVWIEDDDLWLVRAAIIHQLKAKERTDVDRLARHCRRRADHPDFFVRKAIGWALRSYSYTDPAWVERFVATTRLSPLSAREAMKVIDRRRDAG